MRIFKNSIKNTKSQCQCNIRIINHSSSMQQSCWCWWLLLRGSSSSASVVQSPPTAESRHQTPRYCPEDFHPSLLYSIVILLLPPTSSLLLHTTTHLRWWPCCWCSPHSVSPWRMVAEQCRPRPRLQQWAAPWCLCRRCRHRHCPEQCIRPWLGLPKDHSQYLHFVRRYKMLNISK